jgi:hypothetical protein
VAVLVTLTIAIFACGDDDDDGAGAADSGVVDSADTGVADTGASCPAAGDWRVTRIVCGGMDVTDAIRTEGGIESMRLGVSERAEGGCHVVTTISGASCTEVEEADTSAAGTGSGESYGITSCDPAACTFNEDDAPCEVGDRAGSTTMVLGDPTGDTLTVVSQPPQGLCGGLGVETELTLERE